MRTSIMLSTLIGSLVAAQSETVSVWDLEIVRRFGQTMVGKVITAMPEATVLSYSCPDDDFGCGNAVITNGSSTFEASITTSDIPGQAGATETEIIKCDVTGATEAMCTQSFITVTNGATATALVTTQKETDFAMMEIVVPKTAGPTPTGYPTTTASTTDIYSTTSDIYSTWSGPYPTTSSTDIYSPSTSDIYSTWSGPYSSLPSFSTSAIYSTWSGPYTSVDTTCTTPTGTPSTYASPTFTNSGPPIYSTVTPPANGTTLYSSTAVPPPTYGSSTVAPSGSSTPSAPPGNAAPRNGAVVLPAVGAALGLAVLAL